MKKHVYLLFLAVIALAFNACQKEYSLEASKIAAEGTLRADGSGDCLPKTVAGTYEEGVELVGTENYLEIEVNVLTAGSYTISTDTVNGIYFIASGLFTNTGIQTVQLPGFGTPAVSGISNFVVQFDSTSCSIAVTTSRRRWRASRDDARWRSQYLYRFYGGRKLYYRHCIERRKSGRHPGRCTKHRHLQYQHDPQQWHSLLGGGHGVQHRSPIHYPHR